MKLSDNEIQKLKNKEMKIRDLRIDHFVESNELQVENTLKLLSESILDVRELSTLLKNRNEYCRLLESRELFKELSESNKLNKEDLKYLFDKIDKEFELNSLSENTYLLNYMIDSNIVSFQELVDKYKSIKDSYNDSCLSELLEYNEKLFEKLFKNNKLTKDDLRYLLNNLDTLDELNELCKNTSLINYILSEFVLNNDTVDKFNAWIKDMNETATTLYNDDGIVNLSDKWYKWHYIHNLFELIEFHSNNLERDEDHIECKNEKDIDNELLELNRFLYEFELNKNQKSELAGILKDNEQARNTLSQIVENHLQDQYDFENLKELLTKEDKKKKIKMNF